MTKVAEKKLRARFGGHDGGRSQGADAEGSGTP
jgi:hypothetical protein